MPNVLITRKDAERLSRLLHVLGREWVWLAEKFTEASKTRDQKLETLMALPIDQLEPSVRTSNCLKRAGIHQISQLMELDQVTVLGWRNAGQKTWREIQEFQKYINQRAEQ